MEKIEFINDSAPYLSAENLNLLQDNIEESIEESKLEEYSASEQRIGTWIDGKPLYRNVITGSIDDSAILVSNVDTLLDSKGTGVQNGIQRVMPYYEIWNDLMFAFTVNRDSDYNIRTVSYKAGEPYTTTNCNIVLEYTKTTD